eukprot:TRINITY_DN20313_c0_g2_i1.p1 TRINITY_DN20313_c0_g2~~TRINITY_DN20313_c0_g2_i1.p1  ORF type:complete len:124 (-),score=20.65 TRINITY_DN20313_c0_g2_i1:448-819(-)
MGPQEGPRKDCALALAHAKEDSRGSGGVATATPPQGYTLSLSKVQCITGDERSALLHPDPFEALSMPWRTLAAHCMITGVLTTDKAVPWGLIAAHMPALEKQRNADSFWIPSGRTSKMSRGST